MSGAAASRRRAHRDLGREGCAQPYFRQHKIEQAVFEFLQALMIPGLAEAVDAASGSSASRTSSSSANITKSEYVARKNDLLIERDQLEAQPAAASIALQRQRLVHRRRLVGHDR